MKSQNLSKAVLFIFVLALCLPLSHRALACSPGEKAEVKWKGSWYPATVLQAKGKKCYIHYDGYNNSWDEWVGPGRIRISSAPVNTLVVGVPTYSVGEAVMVLWHGSWWPAHVIQSGVKSWKIHYDNYGSHWDEWVGPSRIRRR